MRPSLFDFAGGAPAFLALDTRPPRLLIDIVNATVKEDATDRAT